MKLIVITPETTRNSELITVNRLLAAGLACLHVRKPTFSKSDYRAYLKDISSEYASAIVIHAHFDLYDELSLGGIHLSSVARTDEKLWQEIKQIEPRNISTSFHSWQEIKDNEFPYRYAFISPVFDSISKPGYKAAIELSGAEKTRSWLLSNKKYCPGIIGLGGVDASNLKLLQENGFDGAAMLGAIWEADDPTQEFIKARTSLQA